MTLSANWPGRATPENDAGIAALFRHIHHQGRRWHLLARLANLPERSREATQSYHNWLNKQWWDAQTNTGRFDELIAHGEISVGIHDYYWLAFATGAAAAYVRAYDFAPGDVTEFMLIALFVHDYGFSAADIRALRRRATLLTQLFGRTYCHAREAGEENAAYYLEQNRQRHSPPPLAKKPPAYTDLLELHLAQEQRAIH